MSYCAIVRKRSEWCKSRDESLNRLELEVKLKAWNSKAPSCFSSFYIREEQHNNGTYISKRIEMHVTACKKHARRQSLVQLWIFETGILFENKVRLLSVIYGRRLGYNKSPVYAMLFFSWSASISFSVPAELNWNSIWLNISKTFLLMDGNRTTKKRVKFQPAWVSYLGKWKPKPFWLQS